MVSKRKTRKCHTFRKGGEGREKIINVYEDVKHRTERENARLFLFSFILSFLLFIAVGDVKKILRKLR